MKLFALALLAVAPMLAAEKLDLVQPFNLPDGAVLIVSVADPATLPVSPAIQRQKWIWCAIGNPQQPRYWVVINKDYKHPLLVQSVTVTGILMDSRPFDGEVMSISVLDVMR